MKVNVDHNLTSADHRIALEDARVMRWQQNMKPSFALCARQARSFHQFEFIIST
jgi:hypothetical protein